MKQFIAIAVGFFTLLPSLFAQEAGPACDPAVQAILREYSLVILKSNFLTEKTPSESSEKIVKTDRQLTQNVQQDFDVVQKALLKVFKENRELENGIKKWLPKFLSETGKIVYPQLIAMLVEKLGQALPEGYKIDIENNPSLDIKYDERYTWQRGTALTPICIKNGKGRIVQVQMDRGMLVAQDYRSEKSGELLEALKQSDFQFYGLEWTFGDPTDKRVESRVLAMDPAEEKLKQMAQLIAACRKEKHDLPKEFDQFQTELKVIRTPDQNKALEKTLKAFVQSTPAK